MKDIKVLGPGCPKCAETYKVVTEAVAEAGAEAKVEKISDFAEIAKMGVFSTPAVVIDGQIKVVGRAPKKAEVLTWLA